MPFIARSVLRCSGIAWILSQVFLVIALVLFSIDYNAYNVENEEDVIALHDVLSSSSYRAKVEVGCVCMWICYPLLLIAGHGAAGWFGAMAKSSPYGSMFVYASEKSLYVYITVMFILVPAIALCIVSADWTFHETTSDGAVPTGYYIQLNLVILILEILDCLAVADAGFLLFALLFLYIVVYTSQHGNEKYKQFLDAFSPTICSRKLLNITMVLTWFFFISLFIAFCIVLFEFAENGFFSPTGYAKFLISISFLTKIWVGIRTIYISRAKKYVIIKRLFDDEFKGSILDDQQQKQYQMEQVTIDPQNADDMEHL